MKNMKKFFSLVLAIVMVMALAAPVMAAEDHNDHTITINEANAGHEFQAYQIFSGSVTQQSTGAVLADAEWGTGVTPDKEVEWTYFDGTKTITENLTLLKALQNQYINPTWWTNYSNDEDAAGVVKTLSSNNSTAHARFFAKVVGKYLSTDYKSSTYYEEDSVYKITGLTDGYYLVKEKDDSNVDPETHTDYILQLIQDVTIEPKDGTVTVEKEILEGGRPVKVADNNIGEEVTFEIDGTLPGNYAEFVTFHYAFVDTMTKGLTLNENTIKISTVNGDTIKEIDSSYYTVYTGTSVPAKYGEATLVVEFSDLKALTASTEYTVLNSTTIRVTYTATVNSDAVIGSLGNPNEVYIYYDRSPYTEGEGKTEKDIVHVFTFQLDVSKIDGSDASKILKGVKFVLSRERSGHKQYVVLNDDMTVKGWTNWLNEADLDEYLNAQVDAGELNEEDKVDRKAELMASPGIATQIATNEEAKFAVKGLDQDTYWLTETQPVSGYDSIEPIKFTIKADYDATAQQLVSLTITLEGENAKNGNIETGTVATTVINNPGQELPTTGGMGTTLFYVFGSIMVIGASVLLITKKRMAA